MNRLFDMENPFWQGLSIVADMMMLNLLTLLCSLPLVTLGAAFTAMNDVVIRIVRQEEGGIVRGFGKAFRQNLKNGCLFGLLLLAVMGILYFDYLCARSLKKEKLCHRSHRAVLLIQKTRPLPQQTDRSLPQKVPVRQCKRRLHPHDTCL